MQFLNKMVVETMKKWSAKQETIEKNQISKIGVEEIMKGQLAYTLCQVPIVYNLSNKGYNLKLTLSDNSKMQIESNKIDKEMSRSIFNREGLIKMIELDVNEKFLFI